ARARRWRRRRGRRGARLRARAVGRHGYDGARDAARRARRRGRRRPARRDALRLRPAALPPRGDRASIRGMSTFRDLHHGDAPFVLPNAWDYASAAALFDAGFSAVGTTSAGVAIAAGKPDAAGATRTDTVALTRAIAPLGMVTVDVESGFGGDVAELA